VCKTAGGFLAGEKASQPAQSNAVWEQLNKKGNAPVLDGEKLVISLQRYVEAGQTWTRVRVHTDNMELAADIVQDMAKYFKWNELDSEADFPDEYETFQHVSVY
jgi:hypothetical protein